MFAAWSLIALSLFNFSLIPRIPLYLFHQNVYKGAQRITSHRSPVVSPPHANPTKSFWTHGAPDANPFAREGSEGKLTLDADTVIIGSGITGVGVAYHLSQLVNATGSSHNIIILEARDFCSGATARNGGHLVPTAFHGFRKTSDAYNVVEAIKALWLEKYTTESLLLALSGHEAEVDLVSAGHITLFFEDNEELEWMADWSAANAAGVDVRRAKFMSKHETQEKYGPSFSSVITPGHNLWPLKAVSHIFRLARRTAEATRGKLKIDLHTHTPVTNVHPIPAPNDTTVRSRRWILETPRGNVTASNVIHATNGYAAHLLPFLAAGPPSIVPTRGQVLSTRASVGIDKILRPGFGANEGYEYWFPRPLNQSDSNDHPLIILGGGRDAAGPNFELGVTDDSQINPNVSDELKSFLPATYPAGWFEKNTQPEMEWTGIMGYTESTNPLVGPVVDSRGDVLEGQFIAAGYTGHGMPRAFGCAEALAQMVISTLRNESWKVPHWFPEHILTTSTSNKRTRYPIRYEKLT